VGLAGRLSDRGVNRDQLPRLSEVAFADICHHTNPRPCTRQDLQALFEAAL